MQEAESLYRFLAQQVSRAGEILYRQANSRAAPLSFDDPIGHDGDLTRGEVLKDPRGDFGRFIDHRLSTDASLECFQNFRFEISRRRCGARGPKTREEHLKLLREAMDDRLILEMYLDGRTLEEILIAIYESGLEALQRDRYLSDASTARQRIQKAIEGSVARSAKAKSLRDTVLKLLLNEHPGITTWHGSRGDIHLKEGTSEGLHEALRKYGYLTITTTQGIQQKLKVLKPQYWDWLVLEDQALRQEFEAFLTEASLPVDPEPLRQVFILRQRLAGHTYTQILKQLERKADSTLKSRSNDIDVKETWKEADQALARWRQHVGIEAGEGAEENTDENTAADENSRGDDAESEESDVSDY